MADLPDRGMENNPALAGSDRRFHLEDGGFFHVPVVRKHHGSRFHGSRRSCLSAACRGI